MVTTSISPEAVARASQFVDAAVSGADAAIELRVPKFFGRDKAVETLRLTLSDAARAASNASKALSDIGTPVDVARQAVDALGGSITAALGSPDILGSVADSAFRTAVSNAHASASRLHAIPLELDPKVTPQSQRAELAAILAKDIKEVTDQDVERIRTFDAITGEKRLNLPAAAQGLEVTSDRIDRLRVWNDAQDFGAGPGGTKQAVEAKFAQLLEQPVDAFTTEDFRWLAMVGDLPGEAQLKLPRGRSYERYQLVAVSSQNLPQAQATLHIDLPNLRLFNEVRPLFGQPAPLAADVEARLAALLEKDPSKLDFSDLSFIDSVHPLSNLGATRPSPGSDWHSE